MIIAFVARGWNVRVVTRAKKLMSALMRGQGSVPFRPMPSRMAGFGWVWGMGVVATIRVRGFWAEGIFGSFLLSSFLFSLSVLGCYGGCRILSGLFGFLVMER